MQNNQPKPDRQPDRKKPRGGSRSGGGNSGRPAKPQQGPMTSSLTTSRGQAVRAQRRSQQDAQRIANQHLPAEGSGSQSQPKRANVIDDRPRLKVIGLGGMDGGGSKNMILVEYTNDAVIMDCGNDLSVDLPGINYGIADTAYLEQ